MIDRNKIPADYQLIGRKCALRMLRESDRENYMEVNRENSIVGNAYNIPEFVDALWKTASSVDVTIVILEGVNHIFAGYINLQNIENEEPEIGISILKKYQSQGMGTEAMKLLLKMLWKTYGADQTYVAKVDARNHASRRMMEKIGLIEEREQEGTFARFFRNFSESIGAEGMEKFAQKYMNNEEEIEDMVEESREIWYHITVPANDCCGY